MRVIQFIPIYDLNQLLCDINFSLYRDDRQYLKNDRKELQKIQEKIRTIFLNIINKDCVRCSAVIQLLKGRGPYKQFLIISCYNTKFKHNKS